MPRIPLEQRFWSKVHKTPSCWLWIAARNRKGYGEFKVSTRLASTAHRIAWELTSGPIPDGLHVCHHCDNPPCVNPSHLFLGTNAENVEDMKRKGRSPRRPGEQHHNAKLTEKDVATIRERYRAGNVTQRQLGREFGVRSTNIAHIVLGQTWAHTLTTPPTSVRFGNAKLTREKADAIRQRYAAGGISQQALADIFEVTQPTIGKIVNHRTWF